MHSKLEVVIRRSPIVMAIPLVFSGCDSAVAPDSRMDGRTRSSNGAMLSPLTGIGAPVSVGTQHGNNHNGAITLTVGAGGVPEDATLFVDYAAYADDSGTSVSVADDGGNVYAADWGESDHAGAGGFNSLQWGHWRTRVATALSQGSTIAISGLGTGPANRRFRAHAYYVEGLAEDPLIDVSVSGADQDPSGDITANPEAVFLGLMYTRCTDSNSEDLDFTTISEGGPGVSIRPVRLRTSYRIIAPAQETRGYEASPGGSCTASRSGISAYQAEQTQAPGDSVAELYNLPAQVVEGQSYDLRARLLDGITGDVVEEYNAANWSFSVESGPAALTGANSDVLSVSAGSAPNSVIARAMHATAGFDDDTANVIVQAMWPDNEPSGMTTLVTVDGSTKIWPGYIRSTEWNDDNRVTVVPDGASKFGNAIEKRWFIGDGTGWNGVQSRANFGGPAAGGYYKELYFRIAFKFSDNWQFGSAGGKFFYYRSAQGSHGDFILGWHNNYGVWWTPKGDGRHLPELEPYGSAPLQRGVYHTIEIHHGASTAGANGFLRMWVNGHLVPSYRKTSGETGISLEGMEWDVTLNHIDKRIGGQQAFLFFGGSGYNKTVNDHVRFAEMYISGRQ